MSFENKIIDELRKEKLCEWINSSPKEFLEMVGYDFFDDIHEIIILHKIDKCEAYIRETCGEGNHIVYNQKQYDVNLKTVNETDKFIIFKYFCREPTFSLSFHKKGTTFAKGEVFMPNSNSGSHQWSTLKLSDIIFQNIKN